MYNIAITKDKETSFFSGNDEKPRSYPTLADALVSAQYLGLTRQDVELHFVKEGASIGAATQTATGTATPETGPQANADAEKPLDKMNRDQLAAYAAEKGVAVKAEGTKAEIIAAIRESESAKAEKSDADGKGTPPRENGGGDGGQGS